MNYDFFIVGAGLAGCILAERLSNQLNKKVLLIDKRNHIGGNIYDYKNENEILIHKYGPHIFHTSSQKVWNYLSNFTEWVSYEHKVVAIIDEKEVPVPFNLNSIDICFDETKAKKLTELLIENFGLETKIPILKLIENENNEIKELAEFVYNNVFLGYNLKQWGLRPEELDYNVSSRVPIFISRDNRYFQDKYQAMPKNGYTELILKMINNPNIDIILNVDYNDMKDIVSYNKLIYTGPIDSYFDYKFGKLPYRSLDFQFEEHEIDYYQSKAQVNYPNNHNFTRITEFKHFYDNKSKNTVIAKEFSNPFVFGENEPYYPIPRQENNELYNLYLRESERLQDVFFIGRLAEYKYYNMDQIVGIALQFFEKKFAN